MTLQSETFRQMTGNGSIAVWALGTFKLIKFMPSPIIDGPRCGPWGCTTGVISLSLDDGVVLANGWEGAAKTGHIDDLQLYLLGSRHRLIWTSRMFSGKAYLALREEGKICVEVCLSYRLSQQF